MVIVYEINFIHVILFTKVIISIVLTKVIVIDMVVIISEDKVIIVSHDLSFKKIVFIIKVAEGMEVCYNRIIIFD